MLNFINISYFISCKDKLMTQPIRIQNISQAHLALGVPMPGHPLISVIDYPEIKNEPSGSNVVLDFYSISIKRGVDKMFYGQQTYDFDGGIMTLLAPGQVLKSVQHTSVTERSGWIMLLHPDFLLGTNLAQKIKQYEYFLYATNEALFVSEKEEAILNVIVSNIKAEYDFILDKFSQNVIIAHLETLLSYTQRFYERQFITRKVSGSKILNRVDDFLTEYFSDEDLITKGLPSVKFVSESLNISDKYLSNLLKQLTGLTTQQHIHEKLIQKAKEKLSTTELTVSEIAYQLGFGHSQSFSKLFKSKTNQSPLEFRGEFN